MADDSNKTPTCNKGQHATAPGDPPKSSDPLEASSSLSSSSFPVTSFVRWFHSCLWLWQIGAAITTCIVHFWLPRWHLAHEEGSSWNALVQLTLWQNGWAAHVNNSKATFYWHLNLSALNGLRSTSAGMESIFKTMPLQQWHLHIAMNDVNFQETTNLDWQTRRGRVGINIPDKVWSTQTHQDW